MKSELIQPDGSMFAKAQVESAGDQHILLVQIAHCTSRIQLYQGQDEKNEHCYHRDDWNKTIQFDGHD